jgi:hypothetical protein
MDASFPIQLRTDTSRDKIPLLAVTQGLRVAQLALLGTTPRRNAKHQTSPLAATLA